MARGGGEVVPLYLAIRQLPAGESHAIRVQVPEGRKRLSYIKQQLRKRAKRDGIMILSSRNAESTLAWFWWMKDQPL